MKTYFFTAAVLFFWLFAGLTACKQNATEKAGEMPAADTSAVAQPDLGEFTIQTQGKERPIDMTQFAKTVLDIPYAGNENPRQTLDIVYPRAAQPPYKTIVLFHGGGWTLGSKRSETIAPIFHATNQGYALVSVNYRLSSEVTWPAPLHDAKAAIRFLRTNAGKYQLDAKKIVVWGAASGGHIAQMLGATNNRPAFEDLSMGNENASSAVQGVVAWYGVSDISRLTDIGTSPANTIMGFDVRFGVDKTRDASPIELVTAQYPPILLVHGTNDQIVPYRQSVDMLEKVNEATGKQTARLKTFEGESHGGPAIKTRESVAEDLNFVDSILFDGKNPYRNDTFWGDIKLVY